MMVLIEASVLVTFTEAASLMEPPDGLTLDRVKVVLSQPVAVVLGTQLLDTFYWVKVIYIGSSYIFLYQTNRQAFII